MTSSQRRVPAWNRSRWKQSQGRVFKAGPEDGSGEKGPTPVTQLQQGSSLDTQTDSGFPEDWGAGGGGLGWGGTVSNNVVF